MNRRVWAATLVAGLVGCGAPGWAQDDRTVREMALLITLKEYDLSCRKLDAAARARFEAFATMRIRGSNLSAAHKSEVLNEWRAVTASSDFNCGGDNALLDAGLAIFVQASGAARPDDCGTMAKPMQVCSP